MRTQSQHGFTLIELMITIVIIAILASIAIPGYQKYVKKAKIQGGQSDLVGLGLTAESTYQRQLSYTTGTLTGTNAIKASPTFKPWNPTSSYFDYSYTSADGTAYTLTATGKSDVAGCTITLNNAGVKNVAGCDPVTQWIN